MSIEINWEKLFSPGNNGADGETNIHTNINEQIREFLDKQFQQINLPSYIQSVYITTFDLGTVPPEVEIKNITDPFPEFYSDDEESGNEGSNEFESGQGDSEFEIDDKLKAKGKGRFRGDVSNGSREPRTKPIKPDSNKKAGIDGSNPSIPQPKNGNTNSRSKVTFSNSNSGPTSSYSDDLYPRYVESFKGTSTLPIKPSIPVAYSSHSDGFKSDRPNSPSTPPRLQSPYLPASNSGLFTYFHPSLSSSGYMSGMRTPLLGNWGPLTRGMSGISLNEYQRQKEEVKKKNGFQPAVNYSHHSGDFNGHSVHYNDEDVIIDDDDDNSSNYDHNINSLHKNDEEYNSEETDNEEGFTLPRDDDVQFLLKVAYNGDIKLGITATLLINYPSPSFISLPINLTITGLEINTMAVVAYVNPRKMYFSFICDVNDEGDAVTRKHGYNSGRSERVEIIKDMKIESEIGVPMSHGPNDLSPGNVSDHHTGQFCDTPSSPLTSRPSLTRQSVVSLPLSPLRPQRPQSPQSRSVQRQYNDVLNNPANNGSVLRNVGMVERFVLEKVRGIIRDEVAWPGWIALEF